MLLPLYPLIYEGSQPSGFGVLSFTQEQLFATFGNFISGLVPSIPVVRGMVNRVPMPAGEFIAISPAGKMQLATPVDIYSTSSQAKTISQSLQWNIAVDCYGASAGDRATLITMLMRDQYAYETLSGVSPLYATDPTQAPLVNGEEQYEERWRFECALQYTPSVTLPQDSAITLTINPVSVDSNYHPGN